LPRKPSLSSSPDNARERRHGPAVTGQIQVASKPAEKTEDKPEGKSGGKTKLILIAVPVLLLGAGAGLWFSGILPGLLGMGAPPPSAEAAQDPAAAGGAGAAGQAPAPPLRATGPAAYFDMPELVANLNAPGRRASYIKLRSKLELAKAEDAAAITAAMPKLLDLFTTYMRELRPEELRGSAGSQRLREELMARANIALGANKVIDVLFQEILVQ
jgi:flagellar FliL protein